jgi:hypothetical protein
MHSTLHGTIGNLGGFYGIPRTSNPGGISLD